MCGFKFSRETLPVGFWQIFVLNKLPSLSSSCGLFFALFVEIGHWKPTVLHFLLVFEVLISEILLGRLLLKILLELFLGLVLAVLEVDRVIGIAIWHDG
jgi:hypothetical protein